jgi:hypothetical protein
MRRLAASEAGESRCRETAAKPAARRLRIAAGWPRLLVVIAAQLVKRRENPDVVRLRAGLEQLPLSEAEKEEVVHAYKHRNDDLGPVDVTDTVLRGARHYRVPASGRLRIRLSYGEGAWYL